jgi:hypothetical protein
MADTKTSSEKNTSGLFRAFMKAFNWGAAARLFFTDLKQSLQNQVDHFLCRLEYLFVLYLWVSIGLIFLIIGLFNLVADYAKVSAGVVFSIGGLVIFLAAFILLQAARMKNAGQRRNL